jgi:hypothetical protein
MHRLNTDTGIERRPCDYFHLIVGTGTGGLVALPFHCGHTDIEPQNSGL